MTRHETWAVVFAAVDADGQMTGAATRMPFAAAAAGVAENLQLLIEREQELMTLQLVPMPKKLLHRWLPCSCGMGEAVLCSGEERYHVRSCCVGPNAIGIEFTYGIGIGIADIVICPA
jgi:hypothetical protein